jgi:hypothetical protein
MKKNEESEKEIEKKGNDKRKESVSSSKSEEASETDSYQNDYIPIKKETSHYQIIDNKLFNKIIQYIKDINTFQQQLKSGKIIPKQTTKIIYDSSQFTKSLTNEFSIISNKKNEKQNLNQDNENNNNNLYKSSDNVIKVNNPNTSIMNLFMNANKVKEKDKEEILKLKTDLAEITKKTETEIDNYKTVINDLTLKIATLEKELKDIKDINMKLIARQNMNKTAFGIIYTNEKLLTKILSYLETQEKFDFSKSNSFLYKNIFFKAVSENLLKIVKKKNYILEKLSGEDLNTKFDVKESEILDLFREYIINQKVCGVDMRNEIVKSLIFLENYVSIPMTNFKLSSGKKNKENMFDLPEEKQEQKKPKFFSKFLSALKSEIKEEIGIAPKQENLPKNNYISFTPKEYVNIFESDRHVLQTYKTDKSLNVKFIYENSDKIKKLLNDFFVSQLPQTSYQKFVTKICETFSELLFSSFLALNDIKNLEIIMYALYCRYMKYKTKIEDLEGVIEDLNHFVETSRQIKDMMTKAKNELEFKYTNSVMTISQLNNSINKKDEEIRKITGEMKEKEEKYDKFKNEIIKEYKVIKDEFYFTKNERDTIKSVLLELKEYFIKVVTGDLLK